MPPFIVFQHKEPIENENNQGNLFLFDIISTHKTSFIVNLSFVVTSFIEFKQKTHVKELLYEHNSRASLNLLFLKLIACLLCVFHVEFNETKQI